jgi:rubrerythrin
MHAAPSELRSALIAAFHGNHVEQSADHNTLACEKCGTITDDTPADSIVITCPSCNSEHDQDRNNCQNQLARYRGRYKGPAPLAAE